jgi:hypothetical protein
MKFSLTRLQEVTFTTRVSARTDDDGYGAEEADFFPDNR